MIHCDHSLLLLTSNEFELFLRAGPSFQPNSTNNPDSTVEKTTGQTF
jgi:hypothetical protein